MRRVGGERSRIPEQRPEPEAAETPLHPSPGGPRRVYIDQEALRRWLAGLDPEELAAIRAGKPRPGST